MVVRHIQRNQITSRSQPVEAAHVPNAGVQVRQAEYVLYGQRSAQFSQRRSDSSVQTGIRDGHFLRQRRGYEAGQCQQSQDERPEAGSDNFHVFLFGDGLAIGARDKISLLGFLARSRRVSRNVRVTLSRNSSQKELEL